MSNNIDIIISCLNNYRTAITVTKDNIKYKNIFKEYIDNGLLIPSKPNLIVTRKLLEEIKIYEKNIDKNNNMWYINITLNK